MTKSNIGYRGVGADGKPVEWYYAWNPGGFGCSANCDGCWARAMSRRLDTKGCPKCLAFEPHFHAERLDQPSATKKPGVVLVNFTGDLFDPGQLHNNIFEVFRRIIDCNRNHKYVLLTRQYRRMFEEIASFFQREQATLHEKCYFGTTCTSQDNYDSVSKFLSGTGVNWWVSAEPLASPITPNQYDNPRGIVVGTHNQRKHDCGLPAIRETVKAFRDAGVPVYLKQTWAVRCVCTRTYAYIKDFASPVRCCCGTPASQFRTILATDPPDFPYDLRYRELPWTLATKAVKP